MSEDDDNAGNESDVLLQGAKGADIAESDGSTESF